MKFYPCIITCFIAGLLFITGCSTNNGPTALRLSSNGTSASVTQVSLANSTTFSAKSCGWSSSYANAFDGDIATKARAGTSEDWLEFNLGGTYTVNRARILEDNDGTMELGSWKVRYYDGAWKDCFAYASSNSASWQEINFPDVHGATKVRIYCRPPSGKTIEIQEFKIFGTPASPANLLPGPWVFERANVDGLQYTIVGNEIDFQCSGSQMNATSLPYEGAWFSQSVPSIVAGGKYRLTLDITCTDAFPVICSAKLCGTWATVTVPAATDGYNAAVQGDGTITFDFTAPASVSNPTVEILNRPLIAGGDGTYGEGIEDHTVKTTLVKLP